VGVNQKVLNKNDISIRNKVLSILERSQPKGVKSKIIKGKLRTGVNWQGTLKKKGVKQELGVYRAHFHNKVHITGEETLLTC
jgi:hypothetical protein